VWVWVCVCVRWWSLTCPTLESDVGWRGRGGDALGSRCRSVQGRAAHKHTHARTHARTHAHTHSGAAAVGWMWVHTKPRPHAWPPTPNTHTHTGHDSHAPQHHDTQSATHSQPGTHARGRSRPLTRSCACGPRPATNIVSCLGGARDARGGPSLLGPERSKHRRTHTRGTRMSAADSGQQLQRLVCRERTCTACCPGTGSHLEPRGLPPRRSSPERRPRLRLRLRARVGLRLR
jgi:hypothetical protein